MFVIGDQRPKLFGAAEDLVFVHPAATHEIDRLAIDHFGRSIHGAADQVSFWVLFENIDARWIETGFLHQIDRGRYGAQAQAVEINFGILPIILRLIHIALFASV